MNNQIPYGFNPNFQGGYIPLPNQGGCNCEGIVKNLEGKLSRLERQMKKLEERVSRIDGTYNPYNDNNNSFANNSSYSTGYNMM